MAIFMGLSYFTQDDFFFISFIWLEMSLFSTEKYPTVYMYHVFFIHFLVEGHLGYL